MQDATARPVLQLQELVRTFRQGDREIPVLKGASADLYPGQAVALVGPSGAGKSTLLHIAGLLETPDGGRVIVNGADCSRLNDTERTRVRRTEMGFVYQFHQLLPEFSALENVAMPQMIRGLPWGPAEGRATALLKMLASASGSITGRPSSPVASSSARLLPAHWPTHPESCSLTSPRATSTPAPRRWSSASSSR